MGVLTLLFVRCVTLVLLIIQIVLKLYYIKHCNSFTLKINGHFYDFGINNIYCKTDDRLDK